MTLNPNFKRHVVEALLQGSRRPAAPRDGSGHSCGNGVGADRGGGRADQGKVTGARTLYEHKEEG
eukprot:CAMPEP_0198702670 /NCGR_PEP_ID=MMETSP1468-20131203/388886_1 /TAXON_ID=1461545 /ORGANISM="Mantoniella sp, Strain CCMP1436" /LENGTH=64 /DNA_ID=CAMNT_0044461227 /DNA_START=1676 /DNA_END=1867 /DNA_ORIENTATION=-